MHRSTAQRVNLSELPPRQRRQLAILLLPVATVLLAAGVLLAWLAGSAAGHLVGILVTLLALVLTGIGYGLLRSARADERERLLDQAIRQATGPCGTDCEPAGCSSTDCEPASCSSTDCAVKALPRR